MIALTQEKREEKIKRLNKIASWADSYGADHNVMIPALEAKEMAEAYIASLTAECKYFQWKWARDENAAWTTTPIEKLSDAVSAFGEDGENVTYRMLFTAPPVPEITLPEKLPCDVSVAPNVVFRKGVNTQTLLNCLIRKSSVLNEAVD
ncbi:hypothetical protein [Rosenbergiella collisarenosi]|uniref:hypothetical protein n=1 Tax=Rosenbergiella collisarenosi TaxID=1544695 RepID=UPI001F4EAB8C|nr:hypothetical protein [Rosenbergiella collisarenosi]